MQVRYSALIIGLLFLILGIAGFVPMFVSIPNSSIAAPIDAPNILNTGYGYLLGLFPTNYLHNAVHIAVGVLGIAVFTSFGGSVTFLRLFAITYAALSFLGLFPLSNIVFDTMPIFGNNVWLNAVSAAVAAYYGFVKPANIHNIGSPSGA
ncbi:MAG: DUF4383 domain-containing protein [Oscillatoriales cyanobacterium C42_A2020_001]|nr:DUF4383 domain-containing protein [Leptolyngbyaceae cyanobacterium C42_A2020_001]